MTNQAGKMPWFTRNLWCLVVGSMAHRRHVKKRDPEASLCCTGFCDLIFKGCASFSQAQNPQTNKAQKMRYVQ